MLMLSSGLQAILGFLFWVMAARLFAPRDVGAATSLISASTLIAYVSLLGLNSTLVRYLPPAGDPDSMITSGLILVAGCATLLATCYALAVPAIAPALAHVVSSPPAVVGFVAVTAAGAVNLLTDAVFIAARKAGLNAVLDGGVGGLTKILVIGLIAGGGSYHLFGAATSGFVTAGFASMVLMTISLRFRPSVHALRASLRPLVRFSSVNYVGNVLNLIPSLVVPLIVLDRVGERDAAYYYIAFQIATLLYAGAFAVEQSFLAEGAYERAKSSQLFWRSGKAVVTICGGGGLILASTSPIVLSLFGRDYREHGTEVLALLAVTALPLGAMNWSFTVLRLLGHLRPIILANATYGITVCGLAWALAPHGLIAMTIAWPVGSLAGAAVSARPTYRALSSAGPSTRSGGGAGRAPQTTRSAPPRNKDTCPRILIVTSYAAPHVGGVEIVVAQQARSLAARGHEVTVLTSRCDPAEPTRALTDGYAVERIPAWNGLERRWGVPFPLWSPFALWRVCRLVGAADIVHVHDVSYIPSIMGLVVARLRLRRIFITQHVALVEHDKTLVRCAQRVVYRTAGRRAWDWARQITVYNPIVEAFLIAHRVPREKINFTHNGIDTNVFRPGDPRTRRVVRSAYGLPSNVPIVLFVGRLVPKKGADTLIAAAHPSYHIVLAGGGKLPAETPSGVSFIGPIKRDCLPELYQAADIFAFPAVGEMFTLVMQEAMACALPVVATAEPHYAQYEMESGGIALIPADPRSVRNTILDLLSDPERRSRMSYFSRKFALDRFDWESNIASQVEDYRRALGDAS